MNSQSCVLHDATHFAEHPQDFLSFRLCIINLTQPSVPITQSYLVFKALFKILFISIVLILHWTHWPFYFVLLVLKLVENAGDEILCYGLPFGGALHVRLFVQLPFSVIIVLVLRRLCPAHHIHKYSFDGCKTSVGSNNMVLVIVR